MLRSAMHLTPPPPPRKKKKKKKEKNMSRALSGVHKPRRPSHVNLTVRLMKIDIVRRCASSLRTKDFFVPNIYYASLDATWQHFGISTPSEVHFQIPFPPHVSRSSASTLQSDLFYERLCYSLERGRLEAHLGNFVILMTFHSLLNCARLSHVNVLRENATSPSTNCTVPFLLDCMQ